MTCRIAFFADAHVGYRAPVRSNSKGINVRVQDGYNALTEVLRQIVQANEEEKIDAIVISGDLFHVSKPSMRDIVVVQKLLRNVSKRGIKIIILAGNHDATDATAEMNAVAPIDDAERNILVLSDPYTQYEVADGFMLHVVPHHGLKGDAAPTITAREGFYNIFATHGAALDPKNKELMHCADSPREQYIPVEMIVDDTFVAKLLGHYHSRYPVGGEALKTYYSGSLVRRGFADSAGARGWMMVTIDDNGNSTFEGRDIQQRPQYDLDVIDAENLNAADIMDLIELHVAGTRDTEKEPIVRQKIINMSRGSKEGLDYKHIDAITKHMLYWDLDKATREREVDITSTKNKNSLTNKRSVNILSNYKDWIKNTAESVPEEYRDVVVKDAEAYIKQAREKGLDLDEGHKH